MYQKLVDFRNFSDKVVEIEQPTEMYGLILLEKNQKLDIHVDFLHKLRQVNSNILIKAIVTDESEFEMFANLVVTRTAKQIDSYLRIEVLMLSNRAKANIVPALEVMATDVKAGHGANVRSVLPEEVFYLRSRGLSHQQAEVILTQGFLSNFIAKLTAKNRKLLIAQFSNSDIFSRLNNFSNLLESINLNR